MHTAPAETPESSPAPDEARLPDAPRPDAPRPDAPRPRVIMIAAVARNHAIGAAGGLVWREPADQRHFRATTIGSPVLMGRKTWDSLPERFRPLPGRRNLVLTADPGWQSAGAERFDSIDAALEVLAEARADQLFVIGGGQVYAHALPFADELLLTEIDADLPGDSFFPRWKPEDFERVACSDEEVGASGAAYRFVTYRRRG